MGKLLWISVAFVVIVLTFETIYAGVRHVAHMHDQPSAERVELLKPLCPRRYAGPDQQAERQFGLMASTSCGQSGQR